MVKKRDWLSVVKKALTPQSKKDQGTSKSKHKRQSTSKDSGPEEPETEAPKPLPAKDAKLAEAENEHKRRAYSVALATAMAAAAALAAAQAATESIHVASIQCVSSKKTAATKIQIAFRGYLVRRELRALRRSARFKSLIQGKSIKRQADTTLRCMQTLARVQSQVRARRLRMSEENRIIQHQLQQNQEKDVDTFNASMGGDWNYNRKSMEQSEAIKQNKQEAAMKRERALAYAFSHQRSWKVSSKAENQTLMDPNNLHWGWSWLERWMAARPWEIPNSTPNNSSHNTMAASSTLNSEYKPSATPSKTGRQIPARRSLSTPPSKGSVSSKIRLTSPRLTQRGGDKNSKSDRHLRRHSSIGSLSSMRNDERRHSSIGSLSSTRNYERRHSSIGSLSSARNDERRHGSIVSLSSARNDEGRHSSIGSLSSARNDERRHGSIVSLSSARNDEGRHSSIGSLSSARNDERRHSSIGSLSSARTDERRHSSIGSLSSTRNDERRHSSIASLSSTRNDERQHSNIGSLSSARNDESFGSSPPTRLAKARSSQLSSPLKRNGMPEKGLAGTATKRLSLPVSTGKSMKQSGPRMENINALVKDIKAKKSEN